MYDVFVMGNLVKKYQQMTNKILFEPFHTAIGTMQQLGNQD
jgi:hypothetical protein